MHIMSTSPLLPQLLTALAVTLEDRIDAVLGAVVKSWNERDLSQSAFAALTVLRNQGPQSASALARVLGLKQPSVVRLLNNLVDQGLVARGSLIGSQVPFHATTRGEAMQAYLIQRRLEAVHQLCQSLSPAEGEELGRLLRKVLGAAVNPTELPARICRFCDYNTCNHSAAGCPVRGRP